MWLQVQAQIETDMFSIEYRNDNQSEYTDAMLFKKGGAWVFVPYTDAKESWLCNGNIEWPEALKRALVHIDMFGK